MKKQITNYTFNASARTITFNDYTSINLNDILLVVNTNTNLIIYNFAALGGSVLSNVLTLNYNTSTMSNADKLLIYMEDRIYDKYDSNNNLQVVNYRENPYGTVYGQEVVSISENTLARNLRLGRPRRLVSGTTSYSGTLVSGTVRSATADTIFYPTCFNIVSDVNATGYFEIVTGIADGDTLRRYFTITAGEYKNIEITQGYYVIPSGNIVVYITATSATATVEVEGVEVSYND